MILTGRGFDLHYDLVGTGRPLLWLHGFLGTGADWRHVFGEPPFGRQLIAPDLRHHGRSGGPDEPFRFREAAADVAALLRAGGYQRVEAIGLSGGGITLLHLATDWPNLVDAMVLVSVPPAFPPEARITQRAFSTAALPEADRRRLSDLHGGLARVERLAADIRSFADDNTDVRFTGDALRHVTAPTLVVFGDRDPLYPVSLGIDLFAMLPQAALWVVPEGGHGPIFGEHAAAFATTALGFLARRGGTGRV